MVQLSLCMIVKNEEDTLERCLSSVEKLVDEIIIIDTGSSDATKDIARRHTDKIYDFKWVDDFAAARNFSFDKASKDYIMWLDADDILLEKDFESALKLKESLTGTERQIMAKYNVDFDDNHNPTLSYYRERIFKRSENFRWIGAIHEVIPVIHGAIYSDFAITHSKIHPTEKGRNLRIYEKNISEGQVLDGRQQYYFARELYHNERYGDAIEAFNKFLAREDAGLENSISACLDVSECYNKLNMQKERIGALMKSFIFDKPRAELCCAIGNYFVENNKYAIAIYWYICATKNIPDMQSGGFIKLDCYGFIPNIQLCVCYDRLQDYEKAEFFNEQAALYKPQSLAVTSNREYLKARKTNGSN